jgi:hypothetical protein
MSYVKDPERIANKDQLSGYAGLDTSGNVGISHLHVPFTIVYQGSIYSVLTTDYLLLCHPLSAPGFDITLNLPDASSNLGKVYVIKRDENNLNTNVAVIPTGTDTIDGDPSANLANGYDSVTLVATGSGGSNFKWNIV